MCKKFYIDEIVDYLKSEGYKFTFSGDKAEQIRGFSTLFNYKENTVTFVSSLNNFRDYVHLFEDKKIKLIITDPTEEIYDCFSNVIQINNPKKVFFSILDQFFNNELEQDNNLVTSNRQLFNKKSYVSNDAVIGRNVKIGAGCVIEGNVYIGDNTVIHHNVVIKSNTQIGKNCTILSNTVIGESGFNPLKTDSGKREMLTHYGGVTIKDNVYIGDGCNISKGSIEDTVINDGVKMNKQVIIAHNVFVGENTVFTAPTFVGGSVKIGSNCHIAATVIRNQCKIGDGATLGLGSVVVKDVEAGDTVIGNPARTIKM